MDPRRRWEPLLNADPAAQQRLLDLQELDTRLDALARRRAGHPAIAALAGAAEEHQRVKDATVRVGLEVEELERQQRRHEDDVAQVLARRDRDQHRLDTGAVSSPRELQDLQSEIVALERRRGTLEDAQLEVMEALEEAQQRQAGLVARLDAVADRGRSARAERDAAWAEIDAEVEQLQAERQRRTGELPADLLRLYETVRAATGGMGAAALRHGRCEGCRLQVDPADARRYAAAAPDEVLRCEECRRILVRPAA